MQLPVALVGLGEGKPSASRGRSDGRVVDGLRGGIQPALLSSESPWADVAAVRIVATVDAPGIRGPADAEHNLDSCPVRRSHELFRKPGERWPRPNAEWQVGAQHENNTLDAVQMRQVSDYSVGVRASDRRPPRYHRQIESENHPTPLSAERDGHKRANGRIAQEAWHGVEDLFWGAESNLFHAQKLGRWTIKLRHEVFRCGQPRTDSAVTTE